MQQSRQILAPVLDIWVDIPKELKFSTLLSPLWGRKEIQEERDNNRQIMKYQQNNLKKDTAWQVLRLQVRPASTIRKSTIKSLHTVQHKHLGRRTNRVTAGQVKLNNDASKSNYNGSHTKRQIELQPVETHFKMNGVLKKHQKFVTLKHRELQIMMDRDENKGYKEVKRKNPRLRRTELFMGFRRNRQPQGERKAAPRKVKLPNGIYKNRFTDTDFYITTRNLNFQDKGNKKEIPEKVTLTADESRKYIHLDPNTNRELELLPRREEMIPKEFNSTNNGSKETGFSLETTENMQIKCFPREEQKSMEVINVKSGSRNDELSLNNTTSRQLALWCIEQMKVPTKTTQMTKDTFSNTWKKTGLESQPEIDGSNSNGGHQTHLLIPSDTFLQAEGSGSSERNRKWAHENKLSLAPNTASSQYISIMRQTKHTFNLKPSPTSKMDTENPRATGSAMSQGLHDSLFSPQEATMNSSESTNCKPGYKKYSGICRSLCDIGGIYCESGGQCVIVENIGAMCRCQQTNYLCYSGDCCHSSLTLIQLACAIGSCCILLSVLLGCLPVLIRRMDINAVSKSVRTRLWISNLMADFVESSSSHSIESDITISSDYESPPDLSTFHCTKEVTRDSDLWKSESTRL